MVNRSNGAIPSRLANVRDLLRQNEVDALLVSQPENRGYLSGFTGSTGWLLISADKALFAADFRYYEQVGLECPDFELVKLPFGGNFTDVLPAMLQQAGVHRLGFEADHATFANVQDWSKAAPNCEWNASKGLAAGLRAVKDAGEIAAIRAAVKLADEALAAALAQARPGMTERELAWLIESAMRTHGAEAAAFEIIVSCGPNAARPHARAGDTRLAAGEPIVIDMGARLGRYNSDLTRTVCLGRPNDPDKFWKVYNTVLQAQLAAEAALRPGITGKAADAVARDLIAAAGFGDYFGHGLGHGVGLAVHEEPRLSRLNEQPLVAGNVVTVEPGVYLPGWGGVRIEDMAVITENGVEILTGAPKDPIIRL
jgi:Xaa-Pro aminopeptidase